MDCYKNISYLHARDPSIISSSYAFKNVRKNLEEQFGSASSSSNSDGTDESHLQVYLRLKLSKNFQGLYQIADDNTLICTIPDDAHCVRNMNPGVTVKKTFTFSKIFGPNSDQTEIFNNIIKAKVLSFINGNNSSLLTYGASGSGKTYTIVGTADEPGMVPRALEYLFRTLPQLNAEPKVKATPSNDVTWLSNAERKAEREACQALLNTFISERQQHIRTYKAMQKRLTNEPIAKINDDIADVSLSVWVSYAEIYNECIYDLLAPTLPRGQPRKKLRLGHSKDHSYIKELTSFSVTSGLEAYQALQYGLHNLKYAATSLNDHSSRSHSIFTIKLVQSCARQEEVSISAFNFCDLAGSERSKKSNNVGDRLKESNNINTSLLVLGRCVSLVREMQQKQNFNKPIPFRESKLTQLFRRALLGHEAVSMIVNINPVREMFDESQHVLNFSAIAKDVAIQQQQVIQRNRFTQYLQHRGSDVSTIEEETSRDTIEHLENQIADLQIDLEEQKTHANDNAAYIIREYKQMMATRDQYWEARIKRMEQQFAEKLQELKEDQEVIVLDSSTEEETREAGGETAMMKCTEYTELHTELIDLKSELNIREMQNREQAVKIKNLEDTLIDARKLYNDLECRYTTDMNRVTKKLMVKEGILDLSFSGFSSVHSSDSDSDDSQQDANP